MALHLEDLELDLVRTDEAEPALRAHVDACPACRERLAALGRLADHLALPATAEVPVDTERAILELAARRARTIRRQRAGVRHLRWAAPLAAAAAAALILLVAPEQGASPAGPMDLTGDGRVDVLDAFALARAVEAGAPPPDADVTGDGAVDHRDVEAVARAAVRLEPQPAAPPAAPPAGGTR